MAPERPQMEPDDERLFDNMEALKVYFDPLRHKIVSLVSATPRTVHEIADSLGVPFTRLYYHINLLEKHGIIRVVDVRSLPGAIEEKYYQVTARSFVVDRSLLKTNDPDGANLDILLEMVFDEARKEILRSVREKVINLHTTPPEPDSVLMRRGYTRMTPDQARRLYQSLLDILAESQVAEASATDQYYGIVVSLYPVEIPHQPPDSEKNEAG